MLQQIIREQLVYIIITIIATCLLICGYLWVDEIIKMPKHKNKREKRHKRLSNVRRLK